MGRNDSGQSTVPAGLNGVVAIAAGVYHSLALIAASAVQHSILEASVSGGRITLSWPLWDEGFMLQATTNPADPSSWATLTNLPVIVNQQYTVTNPVADGQRFFRLKN